MTQAIARILALFLIVSAPAAAQDRQISVSGQGRVSVVPDTAWVTAAVVTEAPAARDAMTANAERMSMVMARLDDAGFPVQSRQTSGLSLQPRWRRPDPDRAGPALVDEFTARNELTLKLDDLSALPALLDMLVSEDGANVFGGLRFGMADPQAAEDAALAAALADARRKAELLAAASGAALGPVLSITEGAGSFSGPNAFARMEAANAASGVPVAPGAVEVTASVTLVLALED